MDLGARLKALRTARGLSQRQLAARAGVTNGLISQIEQNRTSPSVATLKRILEALPITLSDFFSVEVQDRDRIFYRAADLRRITPSLPGGAGVVFRQVGDTTGRTLQMLHERYGPGTDTGIELYSHEAEEAGIVVSGRIELTVGTRTETLGAGDAYAFDSRLPHRFRNTGQEDCIIISACTPPSF
ncbi:cupin domain-containing protein [Halovulum dunhuangense]|uniref:Cupin domain-containing protein n=2 Tax=Halovulum dunhuangense TaxID=1505036 RepID=A0A849L3B5_9RHOB|nr:cupin domain-containing protein [Halovulum dunhuangense]NNU80878.1 cupin domain-containing protein [Halovulum dunhuangense]